MCTSVYDAGVAVVQVLGMVQVCSTINSLPLPLV